MPLDPEQFRQTMRSWTTGVAVIMAAHDGARYGMTINSFTSLSLDPPLITVALQNTTYIHDLVSHSQHFGVTILAADQRELADDLAGRLHGEERMTRLAGKTFGTQDQFITGGLAHLDCRVVHTYAAGKNTLFVAEVLEAHAQATVDPLVYHNRGYFHLNSPQP